MLNVVVCAQLQFLTLGSSILGPFQLKKGSPGASNTPACAVTCFLTSREVSHLLLKLACVVIMCIPEKVQASKRMTASWLSGMFFTSLDFRAITC